jgi:hypothetical protein
MTSPEIETTESLLDAWMKLAKRNRVMHEAAADYYGKFAETSAISAIVLGSTTSLLNVVFGVLDPVSFIVVNVLQITLGLTGLMSTVIISVARQLELDANKVHHAETALKYGELHRMIRAETVLLRTNESSWASGNDFLKRCQNELDRIEEGSRPLPDCVVAKYGPKCTCSPVHSPGNQSPRGGGSPHTPSSNAFENHLRTRKP